MDESEQYIVDRTIAKLENPEIFEDQLDYDEKEFYEDEQ
jgi:hypothetical protein